MGKSLAVDKSGQPPSVPGFTWIAWIVFGAALAVRLLYLLQVSRVPDFLIPLFDAQGYVSRADLWIRGKGLSPEVMEFSLLYHLFLSATFFITDSSLQFVRVIQILIGAGTCSLLSVATFRTFGRTAGMVAGLMSALYAPAWILNAEFMPTTLECLWCVAMFALLTRQDAIFEKRRPSAVTGILLGLAALLGPGLFITGLLASLLAARRGFAPRAWGWTLSAFALPLLVAAIFIGGLFSSGTATRWATRIYLGNSGDLCTTLTMRPGPDYIEWFETARRSADERTMSVSRHLLGETARAIRANPGVFLAGLGQKSLHLVSSREIPAALDIRASRERASILQIAFGEVGSVGVPFILVAVLAALGVASAWRTLAGAYRILLIAPALLLVATSVTAPDRLPWVVLLIPLCGIGAASIRGLASAPASPATIKAVVAAVAVALLATVPGPFCVEAPAGKAEFHRAIGNIFLQSYNVERARAAFDQAVADDPTDPQAWNGIGICQQLNGRLEEARVSFARAVELSPRYAFALFNLATVESGLGRRDEAISLLKRGLELLPRNGKAHNDLGQLLLQAGDAAGASLHFQEAARITPTVVEPRLNLAQALLASGDETAAEKELADALKLDALNARAHTMLGIVLLRRDDLAAAEGHLLSAKRINPKSADASYGLAALYLRGNRPDDAHQAYTNALAINAAAASTVLTPAEQEQLARLR